MMYFIPFTVQKDLEPAPHCSVQMEAPLPTDKDASLESWTAHFNSVLNRPPSINDDAIDRLSQIKGTVLSTGSYMECNILLDEFLTVLETEQQSNNCYLTKLQVKM